MSSVPVAFFVSGHGFGHAARAMAVAEALAGRRGIEAHFFTAVPAWFFEDAALPIRHHESRVDVGLVQRTSLDIDRDATLRRLRRAGVLEQEWISAMAQRLRELQIGLVVADIAPAGVAAGHRAGIPSVLVENFTWDWIYTGLGWGEEVVGRTVARTAQLQSRADLRIQTLPVCEPSAGGIQVGSIARPLRSGRGETRDKLGLGADEPVALVSMGGVPWRHTGVEKLRGTGFRAIVLGEAPASVPEGVIVLPHRSGFHHPDLAAAADVVVGKLGYSTLAEVWQAGCGYAWLDRPDFPETRVLAAHARDNLASARVPRRAFESGAWPPIAAELASRSQEGEAYDDGLPAAVDALEALI